jgi:hypothetical protein
MRINGRSLVLAALVIVFLERSHRSGVLGERVLASGLSLDSTTMTFDNR